jgi:hypothetical protein
MAAENKAQAQELKVKTKQINTLQTCIMKAASFFVDSTSKVTIRAKRNSKASSVVVEAKDDSPSEAPKRRGRPPKAGGKSPSFLAPKLRQNVEKTNQHIAKARNIQNKTLGKKNSSSTVFVAEDAGN